MHLDMLETETCILMLLNLKNSRSKDFLAKWADINHAVHEVVKQFNGSISAEHGIGQLKKDELPNYKSSIAIDVMRVIKDALDPKGIMNPGKII